MITELTCSTLLMLGIVTRGATLPLLPMLLVLLLVYPVDWPNNLLWGSILLFLLTRGTGRFSVDRTIERHFVARGRYQWTDVHIVLGAQARRCPLSRECNHLGDPLRRIIFSICVPFILDSGLLADTYG
jgi:hypothetical protein